MASRQNESVLNTTAETDGQNATGIPCSVSGCLKSESSSANGQIGNATTNGPTMSETANSVDSSTGAADGDAKGNVDLSFKFFVGGIHPEAWDDDVLKYFQRFGKVKDVQVMKDHSTGRNRGFGFVTMEKRTGTDQIFCPVAEHIIKGKKVDVRSMQPEGHSNLNRKIFVGGINPALGEDVLNKYFKQYGEIEKVTIMRDMDGRSRGFGFVVYTTENVVKDVLDKRQHSVTTADKVEVRRAEARNRTSFRPVGRVSTGVFPGGAVGAFDPSGGRQAMGAMYQGGRSEYGAGGAPGATFDPRAAPGAAAAYYDMNCMGYDADPYSAPRYVGYDWSSYDPMGYNYYSAVTPRPNPSSPVPTSSQVGSAAMYGAPGTPLAQQSIPAAAYASGVGRGSVAPSRAAATAMYGGAESYGAVQSGGPSYGAGPVAQGYNGSQAAFAGAARVGRGGFRAAPY